MNQTQLNNIGPIKAWVLATRPKTLPAAVAPVMVGSAMAFSQRSFTFFGLVAVCGTYYVQALRLTATVVMMGADVGLLITAILVVNNLRDISTDEKTGKRTLAVRLGTRGTKLEYSLLLTGAYGGVLALWVCGIFPIWVLMPFVSAPLAWRLIRIIRRTPGGPMLNHTLASTAKLAFLFSLLLSIGLIL